jgi:hypothetical protein
MRPISPNPKHLANYGFTGEKQPFEITIDSPAVDLFCFCLHIAQLLEI